MPPSHSIYNNNNNNNNDTMASPPKQSYGGSAYLSDSESNDDGSIKRLPPIRAKAREYRNSPKRSKTGGLEALFEAANSNHSDKSRRSKTKPRRSKSGGDETLGSLSSHVPGHAESTNSLDRRASLMKKAKSSSSSSSRSFMQRALGKSKSGPLERMMMVSQSTHSFHRRGVARSKSNDELNSSVGSFGYDSDEVEEDRKLESKLAQLSNSKQQRLISKTTTSSPSNGTDDSSDKSSATRKGQRKRRSKTDMDDEGTNNNNTLSGLDELPDSGEKSSSDAMTVQTEMNNGKSSRRGSKTRNIGITQSMSNLAVLLSPRQKAAAVASESKSKSRRSRSKSSDRSMTQDMDNMSIRSKKSTSNRSRSKSSERKIDDKDLKKTSRRSRSKSTDRNMAEDVKTTTTTSRTSSNGRSTSRSRRTRSKSGDRNNPAMAELATISGNIKDQPNPTTPSRRRGRRVGADGTTIVGTRSPPFSGNDSVAGSVVSNCSDFYTDLKDTPVSPEASLNGSVISGVSATSSQQQRRASRRDTRRASKDSHRSRSSSATRSVAAVRRKSSSSSVDKKKSKSEGSVLIKMSPEDMLRLQKAREEQVIKGAKAAAAVVADDAENDDPSLSNSAFDEAWNAPHQVPNHDVESLIQAVLNSKILEPRARQDSRKRDEIQRLRSYLMDAAKLADNMESERIKQLEEEHENLFVKLQEQTEIIMEYRTQITYLEEECELRKKQHAEVQEQLEQSHEHAEALLAEVEELENHVLSNAEGKTGENGENGRGGPSLKEFLELQARAKELEEELHTAKTVPQLQINDLDAENKTLQARLKAEKLDTNAKLAAKDETIEELRRKLDAVETLGDAPDMTTARQKLQEARDDASAVRKNLEMVNRTVEELKVELDRLLQKNADVVESNQKLEKANQSLSAQVSALNKDIVEWMDKAYKWKDKADLAQRKVEDMGGARDETRSISTADTFGSLLANQSMFLQAAMEKSSPNRNRRKSWNIFRKASDDTGGEADNGEGESATDVIVRTLQEQKDQLEDTVSLLQAENDQIEEEHKEELTKLMIKLAKLESENAALKVQQQESGLPKNGGETVEAS